MSLIGYAIFGLVAGAIARLLHPGKDPMNWFWTMILGIGGAYLGAAVTGFREGLMGWVAAIGASIVLLIAYNFFTTRNRAALPASKLPIERPGERSAGRRSRPCAQGPHRVSGHSGHLSS